MKTYKKELRICLLMLIVSLLVLPVVSIYYDEQLNIVLEENKGMHSEIEHLNEKLNIANEDTATLSENLINANGQIYALEIEISELLAEIEELKSSKPISLGKFKLTAYCNCKKCCGKWAGGVTATGVMPKEGRTIAVDRTVIPLGSTVMIDGHEYIAEDVGGAIKGNRIDVYFSNHNDALKFGVKYKEVFIVKK